MERVSYIHNKHPDRLLRNQSILENFESRHHRENHKSCQREGALVLSHWQ